MLFNIWSIYYGDYMGVFLVAIPFSVVTNVLWSKKPINLIVLASVLAANPVNLTASISSNLVFMAIWLMFNIRAIGNLPNWLLYILIGVFLSVTASIVNWQVAGTILTQFAAISNYLLGPLLFIPLFYSQLDERYDATLLARILLWALVVPSVVYLLCAYTFGEVMIDLRSVFQQYGLNVTVYRLGNVNFHLTRTQVGILLAALISVCASFLLANRPKYRIIAACCMAGNIYLFLVTGSWGSMLAAVLSVIFIFFLSSLGTFPLKQSLTLLLLVLVLKLGWDYSPDVVQRYFEQRFEQSFVTEMTVFDRVGIWQSALTFLVDKPIGRGWDLWVAPIGAYSHNDYLAYGISFGVICGLMYLFTPIYILILNIRNRLKKAQKWGDPIQLAGIAATSVLFINSFGDHLTANRWYFNVVWSIIWFCYYATLQEKGAGKV